MLSDRLALVEYDVPGPRVIHERWILDHIENEDYIIVTPDADIYAETMSVQNQDFRSFRLRPAPGRLPPGVVLAEVYGLPAWTPAEKANFRVLATAEATAERGRRGLAAAAAAAGPGAVAAAVAAVAAPAAAGGRPGIEEGSIVQPTWVAAEASGSVRYGQVIDHVLAAAVVGAKTVHMMADGSSIFCECVDVSTVEQFNSKPSLCDSRIVPVKLNALKTPERPLAEIVALGMQHDMGWKLHGPRTAKWCCNYLVIEGLGFEAHHERFRTLCKLDGGAWGVQEHFQLSMMLRQLIQVDQFDPFNSYGIELMFRRAQTIEYSHSEKARELESRNVGGKLSLEEQYSFGSLVRQAGTLMVSPDLLEHVKAEVEKDVQLAKNMRKAREERELARKKGGPGGKKDESHP